MLTHHLYQRYSEHFLNLPLEDQIDTEAGWIMAYTHLGEADGNTILEDWQTFIVNSPAPYIWLGKCRQVGFSWSESMKKLARSYLYPRVAGRPYLGIFLSLNQDESQEKIRYFLQAHETLPNWLKYGELKLVAESKDAVELANGARILSYPAKAVRGKPGADITFDEAAHIPKVKTVYEGTTAATIRSSIDSGTGIVMGSTPLSQVDLFHDIGHIPHRAPGKSYAKTRFFVRWWDSRALCRDVYGARREAERDGWLQRQDYASVSERVLKYGTERLVLEFGGQLLESFLQEYEAVFGANKNAFIPTQWVVDAGDTEYDQVECEYVVERTFDKEDFFDQVWGLVQLAYRRSTPFGVYVGYDYARKHDWASMVLVTLAPDYRDGGKQKATILGRFLFRNVPTAAQEELMSRVISLPQTYKFRIDATGPGAASAEKMVTEWGESLVEAVQFTNVSKSRMGGRLKILYERRGIRHGVDREIVKQVGSIQRTVTDNGNWSLEGVGEGHHADLAWAIALAVEQIPIDWLAIPAQGVVSEERAREADQSQQETEREVRSEYREWQRQGRSTGYVEEDDDY